MLREFQGAAGSSNSVRRILRAPGFGILTISTGGELAEALFKKNFKGLRPKDWPVRAEELLGASGKKRGPTLIGVPSDSGGGICRGAAHGPLRLRAELYARGKAWKSRDAGDIPCIPQLVHDSMLTESQLEHSGRSLWSDLYRRGAAVSPLNLLEDFLFEEFTHDPSFRPLVLGGDHSISGAVFKALARAGLTKNLAVLHIDAHTDLLETRFGVDHCFGTWAAHAVKSLDHPAGWVQLGIRASGQDKRHWESTYGLRQFWSHELKKKDPILFADGLVAEWKRQGRDKLYVSHDIDGTDSTYVPSTGTPEKKGLDPRWLKKVLARVTEAMPLLGADMVEVAPVLGSKADAQKTVGHAVAYIEALAWRA